MSVGVLEQISYLYYFKSLSKCRPNFLATFHVSCQVRTAVELWIFCSQMSTRAALELHHRAVVGCAKQRVMNSLWLMCADEEHTGGPGHLATRVGEPSSQGLNLLWTVWKTVTTQCYWVVPWPPWCSGKYFSEAKGLFVYSVSCGQRSSSFPSYRCAFKLTLGNS